MLVSKGIFAAKILHEKIVDDGPVARLAHRGVGFESGIDRLGKFWSVPEAELANQEMATDALPFRPVVWINGGALGGKCRGRRRP